MIISIDTKADSTEDIKKVIRLLAHLIGEHPTSNQDIFNAAAPATETSNIGSVLGNMFNDSVEKTDQQTTETKEDIPEVIPY